MRVATFDLETDNLLPDLTRVWCAHVKVKGVTEHRTFTPEDIHELPAYLDTFAVLLGHNCIGFDFPALRKVFGYEYRGTKVDTLLMSRLQRPNRNNPRGFTGGGPHSVAAWGARLGHAKVGHEDWTVFSPEMLHRCIEDVNIQEQIYDALIEEGRGEGWTNAHRLNHKLFHYLQMQEEFGWLVDQEHITRSLSTLGRWINRIDRTVSPRLPRIVEQLGPINKPFKKNGGHSSMVVKWAEDVALREMVCGPFSRVAFRPVALDSNSEVKQFLLQLGWEPAEWNTNNDGERTSPKLSKNDPFDGVGGGLGKLIAKRVQCKQRRGVLEGWQGLIRPDGRIEATVGGLAVTGRLRHSGIVNVPSPHSRAFFAKQMRQVFIVQEGWVLVGCDSKGNQVRQLAARMGDEEFTKAVLFGKQEDGTDIHSVNQRKAGTATRTLAKNFFYGFIFGAGDPKLGKIIGGTTAAGKALRAQYLDELPGLRALIEQGVEQFRATAKKWYNKKYGRMEYRDGYIKGLDGRPILVDSEHKVLVSYLQSDEAIHMGASYVWLCKNLEQRGYLWGRDWGMCIWMHDEFQIACREELAQEVAALANESIAWAGRFYNIACPHEGESLIGRNWFETH